jgi:hypothetical protein
MDGLFDISLSVEGCRIIQVVFIIGL